MSGQIQDGAKLFAKCRRTKITRGENNPVCTLPNITYMRIISGYNDEINTLKILTLVVIDTL